MSAFFDVAKREIKRIAKNPLILVVLFVIPLISCFILASTFVAGSVKDLPIALLDEDNTRISRKIARMVDTTPSCKIKYKVSDLNEGKNLITEGKAYALFYIPKDFLKDISKGLNPKIVYYYNNQTILIGGIITKDITTVAQTVMGEADVLVRMKNGLPKDIAVLKINPIRVDERVHSNPYLNYSYFLSYAAFVHVFQVIIAFLAIWAVGIEFKEGTTKIWLEIANNSIMMAVFGKLAVYMTAFIFIMFTVYASYTFIYGAPFMGNIWFLLLGSIAFILAYQLVGVAFVAIFANMRFALSSGAFYTSMGFTLAGMTYPSLAMPSFGRYYSALLPIRPYVSLLIDQTLRGFAPKYDMIYVYWMLALALVGFAFLPLLKKHAKNEKMWFKI